MIDCRDLEHCSETIRHGSRSFHAASKLLPGRVREPALVLYAFCRLADDEVDLRADKTASVARLRERLERCYSGRPRNAPEDRAFTAVIEHFAMPRELPEALLDGLHWDSGGRRYGTLSDLRAYSARVASSVGAMMCVLMRVRDRHALARACDLGVAMQLTNIARDVGEDAREGRLYLPVEWLEEAGIDPDRFIRRPRFTNAMADVVRMLLAEAETLYQRSEAGVSALPADCRPGIFAARYIYAGIGLQVSRLGCDSISHRARTTGGQKLGWLAQAALRSSLTVLLPRSPVIYARPLPETEFLVSAAAGPERGSRDRSDSILETLANLKARDRATRDALITGRHTVKPAP